MTTPEIILEIQSLEINCHLIGHLGTLNGFQHLAFKALYEGLRQIKDSIAELYLGALRKRDRSAVIGFDKSAAITLMSSSDSVMEALIAMSNKLPAMQKSCSENLLLQNELIDLQKLIDSNIYLLTLNR